MRVSVIVVGFGEEPLLQRCLRSILDQVHPDDEVLLVDHGVRNLPVITGLKILTPESNSGFGGGCTAGVAASTGDVLVFVNSDAELRPGAIAALSECLRDRRVGLAGGLVLLTGTSDIVNSVGLPVHLSGLSWCDGYGEPLASAHLRPRRLASVAGALFGCRRETWDLLGGMDTSYFMYHEDTDLSLRCHLAGLEVILCPEAFATHAHDFSRNTNKMFYLERNRLMTVLGDYPTHLLLRVLPVLFLLEPLYLAIAIRDGWAREKVRAWIWLCLHAPELRARRRRVQSQVLDAHALDSVLTPSITQTQVTQPPAARILNFALRMYWRAACPRNRSQDSTRPTRPARVSIHKIGSDTNG